VFSLLHCDEQGTHLSACRDGLRESDHPGVELRQLGAQLATTSNLGCPVCLESPGGLDDAAAKMTV